jgi:uncharacterized membrane protein YfcA
MRASTILGALVRHNRRHRMPDVRADHESYTGLVTGAVATIGAVVSGWHARDLPAYSVGYVDLAIFAAMMPTILIAAPIGVRAGHWLSEAWLRRIYMSCCSSSPLI